MYKMRIVLASFALCVAQQIFADAATTAAPATNAPAAATAPDMTADSDSKPCRAIAHACKSAGFARHAGPNKRFWKDCMKPVVMGQSVAGVTVDAATVQACRISMIQKAKARLQELQAASQ